MGLIHAQSFEAYALGVPGWQSLKTLEGWDDGSGDADACSIIEGGWHAQRALYVPTLGTARYQITQDPAVSRTLYVQGAFRLDALSTTSLIVGLASSGCALNVNANGSLTITHAGGAAVSSVAGVVRPGRWHYLEIAAAMSSSARVIVRIDGLPVIDGGAIWTSASTAYSLTLYGGQAGCSWSEVIVMDGAGAKCNALLGLDARIALLTPAFTVTVTGFAGFVDGEAQTSPPAGPAYHTYVDDPIPGPSDGVAGTTLNVAAPGHVALLGYDVPQNARSFEAATLIVEGSRSDGGDPHFRAAIQSGTVTRSSDLVGPSAGVTALAKLQMPFDPNGGKPWSREALRDLQAGATSAPPPI